jgi:GMP synthase-like glutamine amidotransferase
MKAALLDLNNNEANKSIGYLKKMLTEYDLPYQSFEVRQNHELPDTSFDIYLSSGGPGSPFDGDAVWETKYFNLLDKLWKHNLKHPNNKKYVFFICHSFQLACRHFKVGKITKRAFKSFGTFPVYQTSDGLAEPLFEGLQKPFWIADFREWQVTEPDMEEMEAKYFKILALEKPNTKRLPVQSWQFDFRMLSWERNFIPKQMQVVCWLILKWRIKNKPFYCIMARKSMNK